ncbi:hypothetical protein COCC4DRAFT_142307, partial [Bipolaris maydis ATCC 48331]
LTSSDTNAIAKYLDGAALEEKSLLWQHIAEKARVCKVYHHKKCVHNEQLRSAVIQRYVT